MDMTLTAAEITSLVEIAEFVGPIYTGKISLRLLQFGMVVRNSSGNPKVTDKGRAAILQDACVSALLQLQANPYLKIDRTVLDWLSARRFIKSDTRGGTAVTRRGRLWLQAFEPLVPKPPLVLSAEYFAVRRGQRQLPSTPMPNVDVVHSDVSSVRKLTQRTDRVTEAIIRKALALRRAVGAEVAVRLLEGAEIPPDLRERVLNGKLTARRRF